MRCERGDANVASSGRREDRPTLARLKKRLYSIDGLNKDLAEQAWRYQAARLKELLPNDRARKLLDSDDVTLLQGDLADLRLDPSIVLLPRWLRDYLEDYWRPYLPLYRVDISNLSNWSHDFVVAYETASGLVTVVETTVGPWGSDFVTLAPCWDMESIAISVWNPDDNVEVLRTPTWTVEDIARSTGRDCSFAFEVEISYR